MSRVVAEARANKRKHVTREGQAAAVLNPPPVVKACLANGERSCYVGHSPAKLT